MSSPNKVIEFVDKVKPNAYEAEEKFRWLSELDGMIRRVVMQEEGAVAYIYPDDADTELLVPYPFDDIYSLYMQAKIDFYNKDYNDYNNAAAVFQERFDEHKKAYIRENMPKPSGKVKLWG